MMASVPHPVPEPTQLLDLRSQLLGSWGTPLHLSVLALFFKLALCLWDPFGTTPLLISWEAGVEALGSHEEQGCGQDLTDS